jgi:hypothetical protein
LVATPDAAIRDSGFDGTQLHPVTLAVGQILISVLALATWDSSTRRTVKSNASRK